MHHALGSLASRNSSNLRAIVCIDYARIDVQRIGSPNVGLGLSGYSYKICKREWACAGEL